MLPFGRLSVNCAPAWQHCEIGWRWMPPPLGEFRLWFVQSGRGQLLVDEAFFELSGGVCFVLPPGSRVAGWHDPLQPLRVFTCGFVLEGWNATRLWPHGNLVKNVSLLVFSAHRSQTLWRRGDEVGRELARLCIEQIVLTLWDEANQPEVSEVEQALDELADAVWREPGRAWNLDDMAYSVHFSRAQFVRRFRARFSCAPMEFVTRVRLERTRELLCETTLSLDSVARAVGYGNAPFLSKNFKAAFGEAPGGWREREKISKKNSSAAIDSDNGSL